MTRLPVQGEEFGRYRLLRKLGQGGMGVVYAAHDASLDREVALKLVVPHLAGDDGFRARFQHEAEVLAQLESPRIVRIYDHGEHDGTLFLVTQLVDGGDLHRLINAEGALPPALATHVLTQVVEGLCDAHAVGVTHRDIKPANVLLRERGRELEAFLCDFGIATTAGADLSRTGTVAGSLPYMAPERHRGEPAGPQGDVYAAGCLLWHAMTGTAPYAGTDVEVAMAHINAPVPQLPGKDDFSRRANLVLRKAMAKDPKQRYPTARALLTDLRVIAGLAPDAISLPGATAIRQVLDLPRRRRGRAAGIAVVAVLAVVASAAVAGSTLRDGRDPASGPQADPTNVAAIGPTTTLLPTPGGATLQALTQAAVVEVESQGGVLEEALEELGGDPVLPDVVRTVTRAPASVRTSSAPPPPPAYRYRCWDSPTHKVVNLSECSMPALSKPGAKWIFTKMDTADLTCSFYDRSDTTQDDAAWDCKVRGHPTVSLNIVHWKSRSAAVSFFKTFTQDGAPQDWLWNNTERIGGVWIGQNGSRYRLARLYDVAPWSITWSADSATERNQVYALANGYRHPSQFRGVPLS